MTDLLSNTDLNILEAGFLHSFVTRRVVVRHLLPGRSKQFISRVLKRLVDRKLLNRSASSMLSPIGVYLPSKMACRMMAERTQILSHPKSRLRIETFDHDEKVLAVSLYLRTQLNAALIPERELKQSDYLEIPDGVFLTDSGKAIALEVENSMKGRTRMSKLLARWDQCDIDGVIYIATSPAIHSFVQNCMVSHPLKTPVATVLMNEKFFNAPVITTPQGEIALLDWSPVR